MLFTLSIVEMLFLFLQNQNKWQFSLDKRWTEMIVYPMFMISVIANWVIKCPSQGHHLWSEEGGGGLVTAASAKASLHAPSSQRLLASLAPYSSVQRLVTTDGRTLPRPDTHVYVIF